MDNIGGFYMQVAIGLAVLVIIVCSIYVHISYEKGTSTSKKSEIIGVKGVVVISAMVGGFLAILLFSILSHMLNARDVQGLIVIATIILSLIICGCAGWIVKTLKDLGGVKKI